MTHPLEHRLKRLMLLRVVMITTLLLVAVYVEAVSETLVSINPLYFLIVATYGLTLIYVAALRLVPSLDAQVYAQVICDLAIITGLVYVTGGVGLRAGFMLLYPISVLSGSVLLYRGKGLVLAALATLFYGALLWAVRSGAVPRWGLTDVPQLPLRHLLYSVFVTGVGCSTVAMIGGYLAESLSRAGRRLQEATLQVADLQELNKLIVNSIQSGLITADGGGRILFINAFGAAVLGRPASELRARTLHELFDAELFDESSLRDQSTRPDPIRFELRYARPDGSPVDLGVSLSPLDTSEPGLRGYLVVFKDVTENKRLEQAVRTKEKLAAVGEMAAYLAHEIRNPLGSISGSAQVLLTEHALSPEHEHLLRIITRESKRLSETLTDFLAQARPDVRPTAELDLGPVIDEAVTLLRNGAEVLPTHQVEFRRDDASLPCLADRDRIAQVFWNLARNGLEAMPAGGVLTVILRRQADDVVLTVRDQGRGLTGEEQRRIFEPYHSRRAMGTGLGLAIVYRIVREHRGDITVRSAPAQGTEVEIRLPLVGQAAPA